MLLRACAVAVLVLSGCALRPPEVLTDRGDVVLLGEQHDADVHAELRAGWVSDLAFRGRLAAVVLEMAERGHSTAGLAPSASDREVQSALAWNTEAWPWERYRAPIMGAVRSGVPVVGANLPRTEMRAAMEDRNLDHLLPAPALEAQQQAIRDGHCGLLPERQIAPMTRVQVARDRSMARMVEEVAQPGKTVLLLAGAGHVRADVGVPRHLSPTVRVRPVVLPPVPSGKDHCEALRQRR